MTHLTMRLLTAVCALALPLGASAAEKSPAPAPTAAKGAPQTFGAPLGEGETLALDAILAAPDAYAGKDVLVEGKVRAACTKKGCWMELGSAKGEGPGCRVTFKNYGFFVPKDSAGSSARLQGVVQVKTLSKKEVDHLEAEGATFAKLEDGTAREVRIVASGLELRR